MNTGLGLHNRPVIVSVDYGRQSSLEGSKKKNQKHRSCIRLFFTVQQSGGWIVFLCGGTIRLPTNQISIHRLRSGIPDCVMDLSAKTDKAVTRVNQLVSG